MPKRVLLIALVITFILSLKANSVLAASTTYYFSPTFEKENGVVTKYYPLPGGATVVKKGNTTNYLYSDHLASTRLITDSSGQATEKLDYYPYGSTINSQSVIRNSLVDKLYTSQILDSSTNLYFYNARNYNPATGAFISADSATGPNRYAYVAGNPVNANDPTGQTVNLPESLKKLFQIPDSPRPPTSPIENIGYPILAYANNILKSVEALSKLRLFGMAPIPKDPAVERFRANLEANPKYQWANSDIRIAQGLAMFSTIQIPTDIAGIPISSVRDTLNTMRASVSTSSEVTNEMPNQLLSLADKPVVDNMEPLRKYFTDIMGNGTRNAKAELPQVMELLKPENLEKTLTIMNNGPVNVPEMTISRLFNWLISAQGWKNIPR